MLTQYKNIEQIQLASGSISAERLSRSKTEFASFDAEDVIYFNTEINKQDESQVILWLIKYEKLKYDLLLFYVNEEFNPLKDSKFSITDNNKNYIDISKLAIVFVFYEQYLSLFDPINKKFDFETYSLKYQWTPMENRLKELDIIKMPYDYSYNEYVVDMDKLNE
jgi:hypothetical protein